MGRYSKDEAYILTRYYSCELTQLYEALEGWKSVCFHAHKLKAHFLARCVPTPTVAGSGDV